MSHCPPHKYFVGETGGDGIEELAECAWCHLPREALKNIAYRAATFAGRDNELCTVCIGDVRVHWHMNDVELGAVFAREAIAHA